MFESGDYSEFDNWNERLSLARIRERPRWLMGPIVNIPGGRHQLPSRLRSALAPLVDRRTDFDKLRDKVEERAERIKAVA